MTDAEVQSITIQVFKQGPGDIETTPCKIYNITDKSFDNIEQQVRKRLKIDTDAQFELLFRDNNNTWILLDRESIQEDPGLKADTWYLKASCGEEESDQQESKRRRVQSGSARVEKEVPPQAAAAAAPVIHVMHNGKRHRLHGDCKNYSSVQQSVCKKFHLETVELEYEDDDGWVVFDDEVDKDGGLQARAKWSLRVCGEESAAEKIRVAGSCKEKTLPLLPYLQLMPDTMLNVKAFKEFLVLGTSAEKPLFLRRHMMDVHDAVVTALQSVRLVSLVGCPGIGKTWCGHLVAYTLRRKNMSVLHLMVRGKSVVAIFGQTRRDYELEHLDIHFFMGIVTVSSCTVCILDISAVLANVAEDICVTMRTVLDKTSVNFMCLLSGHAQEAIIGKQHLFSIETFVMWSWTEEEVEMLRQQLTISDSEEETDFLVSGGSVRFINRPSIDKKEICDIVTNMSDEQVSHFLGGCRPASDVDMKQFTRLMAFYAKDGGSFRTGISAAEILPRSAAVMQELCMKARSAPKKTWGRIYHHLKGRNPGAAGTAFEMLVHLFWKMCVESNTKVNLQLTDGSSNPAVPLEVDCANLQYHESVDVVSAISKYCNGYFTPKSVSNPVFDSVLQWEDGDRTVFIQISIGKAHQVASGPQTGKTTLALWDYPEGGKTCVWKLPDRGWTLHKLHCKQFGQFMRDLEV